MMEQCVIHVVSNQYLEFDGNVQNVLIMTYVLYVTMVINTICDIGNLFVKFYEIKSIVALCFK